LRELVHGQDRSQLDPLARRDVALSQARGRLQAVGIPARPAGRPPRGVATACLAGFSRALRAGMRAVPAVDRGRCPARGAAMSERLVGSRVPDLRQVLVDLVLRYRMKRGGGRPLTPEGMKRNAVRFERANAKVPVPPFVAIESADVGAVSGEWVSMRDQAEQTSSRGVILYFHGGGFVMGSPQTHRV